ncbi:MAG TPA: calcium-binding protein [Alphaproteobacteria bacterium]|nr:calcium-binding protein [Alphaproteobacteria bacterium]
MSEFDNPQFDRIKQVFGTAEIPVVTGATLNTYFEYLKVHLTCPCLLTGIESIGFFGWEERFEFGYGSKRDYERLRQERGSYHDHYRLKTLDAVVDEEWDILVKVQRVPHRKQFTIPLSELQAVDKSSANYQLLNDYSVWFVNWH